MRGLKLLVVCGFIALPACGGAPGSGPGASTGSGAAGAAGRASETGTEERAIPTPAARCADGSCFVCGEGLCPKGFYCDQKAAGGAACSWLPDCAAEPSCACLSKVLGSDCSCLEKADGVFCE